MDGAFEPRLEDYRLLTGAGNFQDDEPTAGAAWGVFVRSPHAFADIRGIDTASAQAVPGVLAVLTAAALDATGIGSTGMQCSTLIGRNRAAIDDIRRMAANGESFPFLFAPARVG